MPLEPPEKEHPDFDLPWIHAILASPNIQYTLGMPVSSKKFAHNSIFNITLAVPSAFKARLFFRRPSSEPEAVSEYEECLIASIGDGLDGATGRAHGGFSSLILDQQLGVCAQRAVGSGNPCSTATLTVDYKLPIGTPTVLLVRSWATEIDGRKIWTRGVIEDGKGKVFATGKGLFIKAKQVPVPSL